MNINDFNPEEIEVVQEKIPAKLNINDIADDEIEVVQAAPKERMTIGKLRQLEEESAALTPRNPIFDAASATGGAVGQVLQQAPGAVVGTAGMLAQFPMDVAAGGASVTAEGLKRLGVISPETATGAQAEYERLANQFGMTVDDLKKAVDYQMGAKKIEDIVAQEAAAQQAQQQAEQEPQVFGIPGANRILDATQGLATMPFQPAITTGQLIGGAISEGLGQPSPDLERMREEPAQEIANALLGGSAFKGLMKRATGKGVVQPTTEVTPEEQTRIDRFNAELEAARQEQTKGEQPTQESPTATELPPQKMEQTAEKLVVPPEPAPTVIQQPQTPDARLERVQPEFQQAPRPEMRPQPLDQLFRRERTITQPEAPATPVAEPGGIKPQAVAPTVMQPAPITFREEAQMPEGEGMTIQPTKPSTALDQIKPKAESGSEQIDSFVQNMAPRDKVRIKNMLQPKLAEITSPEYNKIELVYDEKQKPYYKLKTQDEGSYRKIGKTEYEYLKHIGREFKEQPKPLELDDVLQMAPEELKAADQKELQRLVNDKTLPFGRRVELNVKLNKLKPKAEAEVKAKEPWQMTKDDYVGERYETEVAKDVERLRKQGIIASPNRSGIASGLNFDHKQAVKRALAEGKPVPPEVLAEYPDLKPAEPRPKTGPGMFGGTTVQNMYEKVEPTLKKGADLLFKKGRQAYDAARRNADVTRDMGRVVDLTEKEGKAVETEAPIRKFLKDESGALSVGPLVDAAVDMFNKGRKKVTEMREKREYLGHPIEALQTVLFERFAPAINPIEKKLGKTEATKAVNTVDRMLYADNLMKEFAKDSGLAENMAKDLQSVGLNIDHFGAYAEARRILYERDPRGLKSRLTKQQAIDLLDEFQPKQRAVLQQTFEELQDNWKKTVVPQITGSEVFDPKINNYIENNDNYSRDVVVDYIGTETGKDARYKNLVEHIKGTEKEKLNPVEQMVLYGRAINQFTSREMAKRQLTEMLDKAGEISADPKEGYEPIRYMHKGEWVEKYAPRRIAQSLMDAPRETHDAIKLVDKIFFNNKYAKWMTRQLINNPGFMLGNSLMLDPVTTWAQLPSFKSKIGYPIVHALTMLEKINAPGVARLSKAFGLDTLADVQKKMTKERIYNIGSLYERTTGEETELGDFMKGIGINENALEFFTGKKKWKATKAYNTFEDMVSKVDQSSKESLYRYLKAFEPSLGEEKMATMTREMGTPATKRSGLAEPILRRGTLFGNAILQALRATAKNYKDNPAVFTTSNIGVPAALAYGVYQYMQSDPEARQRWNGLSDYQKKNFINIYTGQDAKDKPIFLSLPLPRVARVFYGMMVDMLENDKGFAQTVGEAVKGLGKGALSELPSGVSRPVGLAIDVGSYMAGKAPYDYYRDSEIIPDQVMKADATLWNKIVGDNKMNDLSTTKAFGSYLLNTYGIGGWFNMDTMKNVPEGYGALKVAPISRLFRMGGSGIPGKLYEAKEDVQKLEARAKILIQKAVEDSVQNEKPIKFTDELKEALTYAPKTIQRQMEKAYVKKMKGMKGSKAFDLYSALKGATMREKMEILKAFKNLNK